MLIVKKLTLFISLLSAAMLLSGCQTLYEYLPYRHGPSTQVPSVPLQSDIERNEFDLAGDQALVGELAVVESRENDTLPDIGRHFGLGYNDITAANRGVSAWTPSPNSRVLLPLQFIVPDAPRKGIVLNVANMRMFYYPRKERNKVFTYPVGIGRGWLEHADGHDQRCGQDTQPRLACAAFHTARTRRQRPPFTQRGAFWARQSIGLLCHALGDRRLPDPRH